MGKEEKRGGKRGKEEERGGKMGKEGRTYTPCIKHS